MAHLVMFLYAAFYIGRIHELFAVLRPLRIVLVLGLLGIVLTLALPPRKRNRLLRLPEVRIVLGLFAVAVVFPVLPLILGRFLRPIKYEKAKMRPYECGIDPITEAHDRFTVRYYIVAMLFLIFDVETIFLLPWAIIFMGDDFSFTKFALVEMFVFIAILVVGYYYAWRKGALEWA